MLILPPPQKISTIYLLKILSKQKGHDADGFLFLSNKKTNNNIIMS